MFKIKHESGTRHFVLFTQTLTDCVNNSIMKGYRLLIIYKLMYDQCYFSNL